MSESRFLDKIKADGTRVSFWLRALDRTLWVMQTRPMEGTWWPADRLDAEQCGTTLDEIAAELDEDFGAALEARGIPNDFHELLRRGIAFASPTTLTNAIKTASPEAKAAALRGLLEERLNVIADRDGYVYLGTLNSGARRMSKVHRVMELLLDTEAM